jgi:hypothetical protein
VDFSVPEKAALLTAIAINPALVAVTPCAQ